MNSELAICYSLRPSADPTCQAAYTTWRAATERYVREGYPRWLHDYANDDFRAWCAAEIAQDATWTYDRAKGAA